MSNTPTLRNMIRKELCQFFRSFFCDRISPGTERNKQFIILIKRKISMHHCADSECCKFCKLHIIFCFYIFHKILVTSLKTILDFLHAVCPDVVYKLILPVITSGCDRIIFVIYQNCFDSGRSELYSKCCFIV